MFHTEDRFATVSNFNLYCGYRGVDCEIFWENVDAQNDREKVIERIKQSYGNSDFDSIINDYC